MNDKQVLLAVLTNHGLAVSAESLHDKRRTDDDWWQKVLNLIHENKSITVDELANIMQDFYKVIIKDNGGANMNFGEFTFEEIVKVLAKSEFETFAGTRDF